MLLDSQDNKKIFERNIIQREIKKRLISGASELERRVNIYKIKHGEQHGLEPIEFDQDEIKQIDELKVKKEAQTFFDSV